MTTLVLYFGCIDRAGHYLFHPVRGDLSWQETKDGTPWSDNIDGGLFGDSRRKWEAGIVHTCKKAGWTGIAWADYSIDTRPGSHSTFVVAADITTEQLLQLSRQQWPHVFSRHKFPALTIP